MNALKPHQQTTLRTLLAQNAGQREIARVTGIDRKTIRNFHKRLAAEQANSSGVATGPDSQTPPPWPPAAVPSPGVTVSLCEPHREFVEAQLRLRRNATAIYQDLVDEFGFDGHYNSVKRFVAKLTQREPEQFDRLEFAPGEEAQVDYGEGALTRVPGSSRYRRPRLFVMTLRYSRRCFRRVLWRSDQQSWARLHEQAWRYFGGACRYVVLDNLKEGVAKPDLYEPELNPVYAATLAHYGVIADPARVGDPNRKGSVENAIGHTQATALKGRRFESIEAHNEFLEHWETQWAAPRIHGNTRRQVQAMFEEERPHLLALPATFMQFFTEQIRTVCDDTCVLVEHSSYAARPARIGTKVLVRIFDRHLEIRDRATKALLRTHVRVERPGTVVLPAAERVFNPSRETRAILARAREIGPAAQRLCELLFAVEGRVGQRKLWGIVGLADRIPRRFVDAACERALADGVHGYKHVKAIAQSLLEHALATLDAGPSQDAERLIQQHPLIRSTQIYAELFERASQVSLELTPNTQDATT